MSDMSEIPASARTVLMVLEDGRTFSGIYGCRIVTVPDAWTKDETWAALRGDDVNLSPHVHIITMFHARAKE